MRSNAEQVSSEDEDFAQSVADQMESFLLAVRAIAREGEAGTAVPLLLLEVSQLLLAGARLGVQTDVVPSEQFEPDTGPDPDLDLMRERLAHLLDGFDEYSEVFDPYDPEPVVEPCRLSDDLTQVATAVAHGLRHYKAGNVVEALWWWQFSYVSSWSSDASSALRALQAVVAHDRLDAREVSDDEVEAVAAADGI